MCHCKGYILQVKEVANSTQNSRYNTTEIRSLTKDAWLHLQVREQTPREEVTILLQPFVASIATTAACHVSLSTVTLIDSFQKVQLMCEYFFETDDHVAFTAIHKWIAVNRNCMRI